MSTSFLTERIFVSRSTFRMLETLSATQAGQADDERPLSTGTDQIADSLLREALLAVPGMAERQKRISRFFKDLANETTI